MKNLKHIIESKDEDSSPIHAIILEVDESPEKNFENPS